MVKRQGRVTGGIFDAGIFTTGHIQEKQLVFVYIECATDYFSPSSLYFKLYIKC